MVPKISVVISICTGKALQERMSRKVREYVVENLLLKQELATKLLGELAIHSSGKVTT